MATATMRPATFDFENYPESVRAALRTETVDLIAALRTQIRTGDPELTEQIAAIGRKMHAHAGEQGMQDACVVAARCLGNYPVARCIVPAWKGIGTWASGPDT